MHGALLTKVKRGIYDLHRLALRKKKADLLQHPGGVETGPNTISLWKTAHDATPTQAIVAEAWFFPTTYNVLGVSGAYKTSTYSKRR